MKNLLNKDGVNPILAWLAWSLLSAVALAAGWQPHEVRQLNGRDPKVSLPAKYQVVTETWKRIVRVPNLIYMPEKNRLLMLLSCDDPFRPHLLHSDDLGETWSSPKCLQLQGEVMQETGFGVCLTYLGRGDVVMAIEEKDRYFSQDYGQTWSGPVKVPPSSDGGHWYQWDRYWVDREPQTGRVIRVWETGYNFDLHAQFRTSHDQGRTWDEPVAVPQWDDTNEVALFRAANGHLLAACRTESRKLDPSRPWTDHYAGLGVSISQNNGITWSQLNILYDWGRHHPSMVLLPDGTIVMSYVVRKGYVNAADGFPQFGIEAIVSRDHGSSWDLDHKYMLAVWKSTRKDEYAFWAACQSTSSVLLPDGSILTAFGTGYRSREAKDDKPVKPMPRDVALVKWQVNEQGLNAQTTLSETAFDSDARNVFDPGVND